MWCYMKNNAYMTQIVFESDAERLFLTMNVPGWLMYGWSITSSFLVQNNGEIHLMFKNIVEM